ncbi:lipopolysaccharide biosynthesis protein [Collinsella tanakaei]|uniref:lipopolysaccharide biosynthesis protein n=1 Tax=Collinsella tanakaei TaxID=626935 RepID=UPI00195BC269|nr:oligosaccharide flippase family protein [Collinsella tanakaei]MBM6868109.1 oligosaccharide flippase family protein [Collinsella tanakaei]
MGKYKYLLLNTGLFALNSFATKFISFFLVPLYTSCMSAAEYGLTDMATTVISLLLPIVTLNISDAAIRYIVEDSSNGEKYAFWSFLITGLSVLAISIFSPLLDLEVFGGLGLYKAWFVLDYAAYSFMNLCGEISRGSGKIKIIPICAVVSSLVTLMCAVVFIAALGLGIIGYFISISVGPMFAIGIYLTIGDIGKAVIHGAKTTLQEGKISLRETLSPMVNYALPLIPNSLFWWLGTSVNRFFITGMLGISASGMFAAAGKVPGLLNTAYGIFQQAWQLSSFQEAGEKGISDFFSTIFRTMAGALTILCASLSLLSPVLASILLKGETYGSWPMIPLLLFANLLNIFNSYYGTVYTSTMNTAYIMRTTVFGAVSCVIFTPILITVFGIIGACFASIIGQGIVFALRARDSRKYIAFDPSWKTLIPTMFILMLQALLTAVQFPEWTIISTVCLLLVALIQGIELFGIFKNLFKRFLCKRF